MSSLATHLLAVLANGWLAGSVLLLLVLVLDRPALLPPRARHLVVLGSLAATVLLALGMGAGWGRGAVRAAGGGALLQEAQVPAGVGASAAWIVPAWGLVAVALLSREVAGHVGLRRLRATWRPAGAGARAAVGWHDTLSLLTGAGGAPLTVGLLRPAVYLPERSFRELSPAGLRAVVAHERAHALWRDPATWAVARLARIALWPVIPLWVLERRLHRGAEAAADAAATASAGARERAEYCRTLLAVARWRSPLAVAGRGAAVAGGRLEERLREVLLPRRWRSRRGFAASALAVPFLALLAAAPWARPALDEEGTRPRVIRAGDRETLLTRLRGSGVAVSEDGEDRIRIVVPEPDERVRRIVRQAILEERRP